MEKGFSKKDNNIWIYNWGFMDTCLRFEIFLEKLKTSFKIKNNFKVYIYSKNIYWKFIEEKV